ELRKPRKNSLLLRFKLSLVDLFPFDLNQNLRRISHCSAPSKLNVRAIQCSFALAPAPLPFVQAIDVSSDQGRPPPPMLLGVQAASFFDHQANKSVATASHSFDREPRRSRPQTSAFQVESRVTSYARLSRWEKKREAPTSPSRVALRQPPAAQRDLAD